jgi:hypothetical protein
MLLLLHAHVDASIDDFPEVDVAFALDSDNWGDLFNSDGKYPLEDFRKGLILRNSDVLPVQFISGYFIVLFPFGLRRLQGFALVGDDNFD